MTPDINLAILDYLSHVSDCGDCGTPCDEVSWEDRSPCSGDGGCFRGRGTLCAAKNHSAGRMYRDLGTIRREGSPICASWDGIVVVAGEEAAASSEGL